MRLCLTFGGTDICLESLNEIYMLNCTFLLRTRKIRAERLEKNYRSGGHEIKERER